MIRTYFTFVAFFAFSLSVLSQDGWELKKDKDGIKVYTRHIDDSDFKEYRAETEVNANIDVIIAVIRDVTAYPKWISNNEKTTLLNATSTTLKYYIQTDIPNFLIRDRDLVNVLTVEPPDESGTVFINVHSEPELVPLNDDYIRISHAHSQWILRPLSAEKTWVSLTVHSEPNGAIPAWLVNAFVVDAPYDDFMNLKEQVKLPKYQVSF